MSSLTHISPRTGAVAAFGAAVALAVGGILQLTDPQSDTQVVSFADHAILTALAASCLLLIPVVAHLARRAGGTRAWLVSTTGFVALAALVTTSNFHGDDYGFFPAVAIPSNLLIVGGLVALAVALRRSRVFTLALAVAMPLSWVFALPLSRIGGGLLAAAFWLLVGWLLYHGELPRAATASRVAPATR